MQVQANVKLQQSFELAGVTCKTLVLQQYVTMSPATRKTFQFQRYASNANYTVNLLHSIRGVDFFNILDGPSNGFELLHFFEDAVEIQRPDGSVLLERGDCVVMDNCGFHHGRFLEPVLRDLIILWVTTASSLFISHPTLHI